VENRALDETIVLVHGIWMNRLAMQLLRRRLQHRGYQVVSFGFPSIMVKAEQNVRRLASFVARIEAPMLHFVGHSLGGMITLRMLMTLLPQRPGRIVLLGSPVAGSYIAQRVGSNPVGRWLLGGSRDLLEMGVTWTGNHEVGVIAGLGGLGLGMVFRGLSQPHDGTVALVETSVPHSADHISLPVTHTGLLVSRQVVDAIDLFLKTGGFTPDRPTVSPAGCSDLPGDSQT
jgi:pimeloyl-ACP methyl ester carboxylesterase